MCKQVVSWFGLIGFFLTILFIPNTTGLDLREQERCWHFVREGRAQDYHGVAVHPRYLSWFERTVLKRHLAYNAELDRKSRINELRELHEMVEGSKGTETDDEKTLPGSNEADLSHNFSRYFEMEKAANLKKQPQ